jgi:hypothetical protein
VTTAREVGLPLLALALLLLPLDIAARRLMLRRGDLGAAGAWLAARRAARAAGPTAATGADETMGRLADAKRRAAARISGEHAGPQASTAPAAPSPAAPEDPMERLRAARDRARRRATGDDG